MFFISALILCVASVILIIVKRVSRINENYWKTRNVTEVCGTFWNCLKNGRPLPEIYKEVYDNHPNDPYVGVYQGQNPVLIVRDIANIKHLLEDQSFHNRGVIVNSNDLLNDNILNMEYKPWKCMRNKTAYTFKKGRLIDMFYIIDHCAREFVEIIEDNKHMRENPFDAIFAYTTGSISSYIFGINKESTVNIMECTFLDLTRKLHEPSLKTDIKYLLSILCPVLFKLLRVKHFGEHEYFIEVIKRAMKDRQNDPLNRFDFIDICLWLQRQGVLHDFTFDTKSWSIYEMNPTYEILAAQAFLLFLCGVDTAANAMHFTLLELSYNARILDRVHNEIDKVFEECNENLTYEDCMKLKYLDMVLSESLRKYPPMGIIQRRCTKDTVLPVGNLRVEEGTLVAIPVYGLHRDENLYPNPEVFDPERFANSHEKDSVNYSYLGFGAGNRNCIAEHLARVQMKSGLAWLLRRFTITEQTPQPDRFERSFFSLRAPTNSYELVVRDIQ